MATGCKAWLALGDANQSIECYNLHEGPLTLHGAENTDDCPQYLDVVLCKAALLRAEGEPAESTISTAEQLVARSQSPKQVEKLATCCFEFGAQSCMYWYMYVCKSACSTGVADIEASKFDAATIYLQKSIAIREQVTQRGDHSDQDARDTKLSQAWNCLANCFLQKKDYTEADRAAQRSQDHKPSAVAQYILLHSSLCQQNSSTADALLTTIISNKDGGILDVNLCLAAVRLCRCGSLDS